MLNQITVECRAGLRRFRTVMLALMFAGFGVGGVGVVSGLWAHDVLLVVVSLVGVPVGLRARVMYRGVCRSLRMLGA